MNGKEYQLQIETILSLAALARLPDIAGALESMHRAKTLGSVLNPTLYKKASLSLEWQMKVAEAALRFQQQVEQIASDPRYSFTGEKES